MFALHSQIDQERKNNVVRDLHQQLRFNISSEDWQKFEEQRTDRGRIQLLLGIKKQEIQTCVDSKAKLHEVAKDKSKAMLLKNAGNKAFGAGNNETALQTYSECLAWMPHDGSKELILLLDVAVVYANRSAALFHLQQYALALQDAEIAFSLNYPSELHYKLHERAGRCCLQMAKRKEAAKHFQSALASLKDAQGLDDIKMSKLKVTLENLSKTCPSNSSSSNKPEEELILPELSKGPGVYLRKASMKVSVRSNEAEGRFVVANEDIRPGEVIFVEKAFVSTLAQEFCHKQCFQCFTLIRAPVACTNCIAVSFCSPKCRDKAWATHHRYECQILGFLYRSGISIICYMALRILTQQANPMELLSWYNLANETEEAERKKQECSESNENVGEKGDCKKKSVNSERQPEGECYRTDHVAIFQLVSHSVKRSTEDNFHRAVMALYLLLSLKRTALFKDILQRKKAVNGNKKNGAATKDAEKEEIAEEMIELKLGTLIFRSLKFLQFNTHEIAGWDAEKGKSVYMGGGLFPSLALCNHSCAPAIVRYFVNDTVIVRAIRIIRQGEQVTENYGQQYADTDREKRQAALQDIFRFNCICIACKLNWPVLSEISNQEMKFRCSFCRRFLCKTSPESFGFLFRCGYCSKETNILKSLKLIHDGEAKYKQGVEFMKKGQISTALGILNEIMVLYDTILIPPFPDFHYCQDALRYCYLGMGNKSVVPEHLVDHGTINALHMPVEETEEKTPDLA